MKRPNITAKNLLQKNSSLKQLFNRSKGLQHLADVLGQHMPLEMQSHCQLANYRQGLLVLHVDSSAWSTRLRMMLSQLSRSLHATREFSALKKIDVKVRPSYETEQTKLPKHSLSASGVDAIAAIRELLEP
jgi:hypothetical protein